ncbi:MAG: DUF2867 domain-containing protein, partial [Candidatus Krumholzibacteriia bacterium]
MTDTANMAGRPVLVTGATGYVGGRLRRRLEAAGARVRCLARDPRRLDGRIAAGTEVVAGDVLAPATLPAALAGVDTAYYLVHSMGAASGFEERDREGATNFAAAAAAAGVRRLVYLGGLGDDTAELSPHLRSRNEVGRILRESGVPTVELRASIVLGSGSLSFEMIRSLTERLPVMITPRWVRVLAQPIAVADLLDYLEAAATVPLAASRVYEIGGADRVSYGDLMREYARQRGLRRPMIPVPLLTPWLSSLWLGLVTPLYARIGRKLIQSIQHPTVVRDDAALRDFPLRPVGMAEAIARALAAESRGPETRWCDAVSSSGAERSLAGVRYRGRLLDARRLEVPVPPERAFAPIAALGGDRGWYAWDQLWRLRGALDLLVGGVGLRRGRSHPSELRVGDVLDCWRVEA